MMSTDSLRSGVVRMRPTRPPATFGPAPTCSTDRQPVRFRWFIVAESTVRWFVMREKYS
jgi:hypothetical protein